MHTRRLREGWDEVLAEASDGDWRCGLTSPKGSATRQAADLLYHNMQRLFKERRLRALKERLKTLKPRVTNKEVGVAECNDSEEPGFAPPDLSESLAGCKLLHRICTAGRR